MNETVMNQSSGISSGEEVVVGRTATNAPDNLFFRTTAGTSLFESPKECIDAGGVPIRRSFGTAFALFLSLPFFLVGRGCQWLWTTAVATVFLGMVGEGPLISQRVGGQSDGGAEVVDEIQETMSRPASGAVGDRVKEHHVAEELRLRKWGRELRDRYKSLSVAKGVCRALRASFDRKAKEREELGVDPPVFGAPGNMSNSLEEVVEDVDDDLAKLHRVEEMLPLLEEVFKQDVLQYCASCKAMSEWYKSLLAACPKEFDSTDGPAPFALSDTPE